MTIVEDHKLPCLSHDELNYLHPTIELHEEAVEHYDQLQTLRRHFGAGHYHVEEANDRLRTLAESIFRHAEAFCRLFSLRSKTSDER